MNFARSRFGVNIVPRMNGMSIRVSPRDCPATVSVVRTIVAANPHRRIDSKFIACKICICKLLAQIIIGRFLTSREGHEPGGVGSRACRVRVMTLSSEGREPVE